MWHVAALSRAKKLPRIQTLMSKTPDVPKRRQTWQEQLAIMQSWSAAVNKRLAKRKAREG